MVLHLLDFWSNWTLEMLVFVERGKPEYPEKNLSEQRREPTTNSTHIWCEHQDSNPGHIGGKRVLSPPCHPCSASWIEGNQKRAYFFFGVWNAFSSIGVREIFCQEGRLTICPKKSRKLHKFLWKSRKETRTLLQQHRPYWHMKVARYSFSGSIPSLSINYSAINKHLEKLPPQMKICHGQGCNDIGVIIATKWLHYLFYFSNNSRPGNLTKSFSGAFFSDAVASMFVKFKRYRDNLGWTFNR